MNNNTNDNIHKYAKKVNKNGWQAKLQTYVLGEPIQTIGYCRWFWTSWLCVLLSPFALIGKIGEFIIKVIAGFFSDGNTVKTKTFKYQKPSDEEIVRLFGYCEENKVEVGSLDSNYDGPYKKICNSETLYWAQTTPNWKDFYASAIKNIENRELKQKRAAARKERNSQHIGKIVKYSSWAVKPLLFGSVVLLGYLVYKLAKWLISGVTIKMVVDVAGMVILAMILILITTIVIAGLVKLFSITFGKISSIPTPAEVGFKITFFDKLITGIGEMFNFIIETIGMIYTKECPLIEWSDKDEPIKKRDIKD